MRINQASNAGRPSKIWAFDSEFLMSGEAGRHEDIQSVQFSDGKESVVIESAADLKDWLYSHNRIKVMYAFVLLPDLASINVWLDNTLPKPTYRGAQLRGKIEYRNFKCQVYDAKPLLNSFGLRKLADCGRWVEMPKLDKPDWLGIRSWRNEREHEEFKRYAAQDAVITSLTVRKLIEKYGADPAKYASAGTLAKATFDLPKRLEKRKNTVILSPLEQRIKNNSYAGRSECFVNGLTKNATYNDVKSLYPTSIAATRALEIVGVVPCNKDDISIGDPENFGWYEGVFESKNDLWGLPVRSENVIYATGTIQRLYHTFDLAAAKAKVHHITRAYKPVFAKNKNHNLYVDMLMRRLENRMNEDEKMLSKAILNSLYGKIGQADPIAVTSNFFAYSTILAHSHFTMSRLFDMCNSTILGTDTDSIFCTSDISGKKFEYSDGEHSIPIILDVKGRGDLVYFRAKNYILNSKVYGRHGWQYYAEDYLKLYSGDITTLHTRRDIKHTLETRERQALKLEIGRWLTKPVILDLDKIKYLLKADRKRKRITYDSYDLVMSRKSSPSVALDYEEINTLPVDALDNSLDS